MDKRHGSGRKRRSERDWVRQLVSLAEVAMLLGAIVLLTLKQAPEWELLALTVILGAHLGIRPKVLLEVLRALLGGGQSGGACSCGRSACEAKT